MRIIQPIILSTLFIALGGCVGNSNGASADSNVSSNASSKVRLVSSGDEYLPIEIKNDTKVVPDNQIYVIAIAKTDTKNPVQCLVDFATGDCNVLKDNDDVAKFKSMTLDKIAKDSNGSYLFHVKHVQSGRIYFSMKQPLSLYFDAKTQTIPDPDGFKTRDPNYYTLYDKVEFSFVDAGVWFNPTAVDFFSLPIELEDSSSITTKDAGLVDSQLSIFAKAREIFNANDRTSTHEWSKLFLNYQGNTLRLMAPGKAMVEIGGQELNPYKNASFSANYLSDAPQFGLDYLSTVWSYYQNNDLKIYTKELEGQRDAQGKTLPVACDNGAYSLTDYIFTGRVDALTNKFVFKNVDGCQVGLSKPQSISLFAGAVGEFDAPNNTPKAIIVREITAAFDVGLLPAPNGTVFGYSKDVESPIGSGKHIPNMNNYFIKNLHDGHYYTDNSFISGGSGPWYDLYSKALHSYGDEHPIYTFAYDDALGQDGTIHEGNGQNPGKVTITLHDLTGSIIPDPLVTKTGFDVYVTVPEAVYLYKTLSVAPSSLAEFAGTDLIFDKTNVALYQVKNSTVVKVDLNSSLQTELDKIAAMPLGDAYSAAMKQFLLGNSEYLGTQGLTLHKIVVTWENGTNGVEELHDGSKGANHLTNVTSPMKLKIDGQDAELYLDPYVILPNNPNLDGVKLERTPEQSAKTVMITIPGNKPRN